MRIDEDTPRLIETWLGEEPPDVEDDAAAASDDSDAAFFAVLRKLAAEQARC